MNLVIQNTNIEAPAGSPKIYRDPLVSEGTLSLLDFSNRGTTVGFDLSKGVYDLAREAAEQLEVLTNPIVLPSTPALQLTADRGISPANSGAAGTDKYNNGVSIHGVTRYLYEKQPRTLFTFWVKADLSYSGLAASQMIKSNDPSTRGNFYVSNPSTVNPLVSVRLADKISIDNLNIGTDYAQVSVEFTGASAPNKAYLNSAYTGDGSVAAGGFIEPEGDESIQIGHKGPGGSSGSLVIYRLLIEDLTVSGRSAEDVITKDYNYVNGINEFAGTPKRPFANL